MGKNRRKGPKSSAEADAEPFYERYIAICERVGVEPVSIERAREIVRQWDEFFAIESAKAERQ
jgi:Cdc6-like AAA superfamily ATPase